jgi:hypothetical protein
MVVLKDMVMTDFKKPSGYDPITLRVVTPLRLCNSARRLPETMNNAPKKTEVTNHPVGGSSIIAEPAKALIKKPEDSQIISKTGTCLNKNEYERVIER